MSTHEPQVSQGVTYSNSSDSTTNQQNQQETNVHDTVAQTEPQGYATESNPLASHRRPSLADEAQINEAAGTQPGEVPALTGDEHITRTSLAQNAPGKLGERGENVLGAMGFGGSRVERPKEDQGVGEKIAEFLGV